MFFESDGKAAIARRNWPGAKKFTHEKKNYSPLEAKKNPSWMVGLGGIPHRKISFWNYV